MNEDLVLRELLNGILFSLDIFLLVAMGLRLAERLKSDPQWRKDEGVQAIIGLFVWLVGGAIRAGWVWTLLLCQNAYGRHGCTVIINSYELLILSVVLSIMGATCCIRVFSPPEWRPWTWLGAGTFALLIPVAAHLFVIAR